MASRTRRTSISSRSWPTRVHGRLGSRPVIDNGWLPADRQVGQSCKTVTSNLYLAIGISGASQHVLGMKGADTIVARNKDPDAPIVEVADYGLVDDLFDVVPALTEAVRERR